MEIQTEQQCIPQPPPTNPRCCCGSPDCAYLRNNNAALTDLEKDIQTAARLGQALLVRHETYMADAERERLRMSSSIEKLRQEKQDLETENQKYVHENRRLLDKLEQSNDAVAHADTQIESLTATLRETQQELQRLTLLAARAERFEAQIAELERDRTQLSANLVSSQQHERSAVQRCKQAERTLADLQKQVERIENEANEEQERHVEAIRRLERKSVVETELSLTSGRLRSKANGSTVVSHFIKDILDDNAKLRLGIVEVRELLQRSHEEVEKLRNQLLLHQPLDENPSREKQRILHQDISLMSTTNVLRDIHGYHHSHSLDLMDELRTVKSQRKYKKYHRVIAPGQLTATADTETPRRLTLHSRASIPSSAAALLQHTSVAVPQPTLVSNRRSLQSIEAKCSVASSSVPTSPQSMSHRTSSIFDLLDNAMDSSSPTSPDSTDYGSPWSRTAHSSNPSDVSSRSFAALATVPAKPCSSSSGSTVPRPTASSVESTKLHYACDPSPQAMRNNVIFEESEADLNSLNEPVPMALALETADTTGDDVQLHLQHFQHHARGLHLRRAASHESTLSMHGMDVHGATQSPYPPFSSGTVRHLAPLPFHNPVSASAKGLSSISATTATAPRPSLKRRSRDSSSLLSSFMAEQRGSQEKNATSSSTRGWSWGWGKWGIAPAASSGDLRKRAGISPTSASDTINKKAVAPLSESPREISELIAPTVSAKGMHMGAASSDESGPTMPPPPRPPVDSNLRVRSSEGDLAKSGFNAHTPRKLRPPGVNQTGSIWALADKPKTPTQVVVASLDTEALRESLGTD